MFPKIVVPQNGWFMMENPIKMDELGVPLFSETSIQLQPKPTTWRIIPFRKLCLQGMLAYSWLK